MRKHEEKVLKLCEIYFAEHENLAVPRKYVLFYNGKEEKLGEKLIKIRQKLRNSIKNGKKLSFSYEFLENLSNMDSKVFKMNYSEEVKRKNLEDQILNFCNEYYKVHGNLAVPQNYMVGNVNFGAIMSNVKASYNKTNKRFFSKEFFENLLKIDNQVFEKNYSKKMYFSKLEQEFYQLFESYAMQYGNLKIPKNYRVVNKITGKTTDLYRRLFEVKQAKAGKNDKKFSQEFFDSLETLDPNIFKGKSRAKTL